MNNKNMKTYSEITQKLLGRLAADSDKNVVFSPLSVIVLLAILADATSDLTKEEIVEALGCKGDAEGFIRWLSKIQKELMEGNFLKSSNAVCINNKIKEDTAPGYEEHLKEIFDGKLFTSANMVNDVNRWVNEKTQGMISKITDVSIKHLLACFLNAVAFNAKWEKKYEYDDIEEGTFTNSDGTSSEVTMMSGEENQYIENEFFTGFTKPYKDAGYSFMALLPKKDDPDYLKTAIGTVDFTKLFNSKKTCSVITFIPEYKFELSADLNSFFNELGIRKAFSDNADFDPMTKAWIKVERILHKAFIEVDRAGTKAAAVTMAIETAGCMFDFSPKVVELDRPFIFAIVHDKTGLPVFTGVVNHLNSGEYNLNQYEFEGVVFDTKEEYEKYIKDAYRRIADRIHPDKCPDYESNEEIRELYTEAVEYYKTKDPYGLQLIEHEVERLLGRTSD